MPPLLGSLFCELFSLLPLLLLPLLLLPLLLLPLLLLPVYPALSSLLCLPCCLIFAHSSLCSQHCSPFYYYLLLPSLSTALFPLSTASSLLPLISTVPSLHWFLPQLFHLFTTSTLSCFLCQLSQISTAFSLYYHLYCLLTLSTASSVSLLPSLTVCRSLHYLCSTTLSLHYLLFLSTVSSLNCLIPTQPSHSTALSLCTTFFSLPSPFSLCPSPPVLSHKSTPGARHFNMQPREEFIKRHNAPRRSQQRNPNPL